MTVISRNPDEAIEVSDGDVRISAQKIYTPKGERLEIEDPDGDVIYLDSVALESLAWQAPESIEEMLEEEGIDAEPPALPEATGVDAAINTFRVSNEFAQVDVGKVRSDGAERIVVDSPKLGYTIHLRPVDLRAITRQRMDRFSEFLETPFGPDH